MSRPFLVTAGSRGDIEPFTSLATGLAKMDSVEEVALLIPKRHIHLAPHSPKIITISFAFDLANPGDVAEEDFNDMSLFKDQVLVHADFMLEEARKFKPTIIASFFFTMLVSDLVHEALQIPHLMLHLQPCVRSAYYPMIIGPHGGIHAAKSVHLIQQGKLEDAFANENLATHSLPLPFALDACFPALNNIRAQYNLQPIDSEHFMQLYNATARNAHVLVATPSLFTPLPPDASPRAHIVGSFSASYLPNNWNPQVSQPALVEFLASGPKPIVVTYGSMGAAKKATQVTRAVLRGLRDAGVERIVMIPGIAKIGVQSLNKEEDSELLKWSEGRVFTTEGNVQYAWLFPQCEMVMCHCGAGTSNAAFIAGIPVLGTPVFVDQPFYIELMRLMKIGTRVGNLGLGSITEESVRDGVLELRENNAVDRARDFAEKQRSLGEDIEKACSIVTQIAFEPRTN